MSLSIPMSMIHANDNDNHNHDGDNINIAKIENSCTSSISNSSESVSSSPSIHDHSTIPSMIPSNDIIPNNTTRSSSTSISYTDVVQNTMIEGGSDSSSDKSLPHKNIIISTTPTANNSVKVEVENETQLIQYIDSIYSPKNKNHSSNLDITSSESHVIPIRFSSFYANNDDIDDEYPNIMLDNHTHTHPYISDSPVSMSPCGSDVGNDDHDHDYIHNHVSGSGTRHFKRLTYAEVEKSIEKYYNPNNKYSNEFDILITYLKGQKNLYIQSKNITQIKLNALVFPSMILTAFITVFAPTIDIRGWSIYIISACNAVIAMFVALVNYLKLESTAENYTQLANQFDKLETAIELSSNKLYFMTKESEQSDLILNKIKYIESKLHDMKETYNMIIPESVKKVFPIIYHINIFSFIKKIETYKKKLIMQFKDIKNEIGYIIHKWNLKGINIFEEDEREIVKLGIQFTKEQKRLFHLLKTKEKIKYQLIYYKNSYGQIDELFIREIKNSESYLVWFNMYKEAPRIQEPNPVIEEFLKMIFLDCK